MSVTARAEADARLHAHLTSAAAEAFPDAPVGDLETMVGGHSGRTFRVAVGERDLVVKAAQPGRRAVGRHDMLRQATILRALAGTGVPVPEVVLLGTDADPWFAMELLPGEAIEPVLDRPTPPAPLAVERMHRALDLAVGLHALDPRALGLDEAPLGPGAELERWSRTFAVVPPELVPSGPVLLRSLERRVPDGIAPTLVHGDFRLGNLLCQGPEPTGLIDWEIWSIGDPRVEIGWFALFGDGANFPGVGTVVPGLPSPAALVADYAERTGRGADLSWFEALGAFKMATIMAHNLVRHREGRHDDPDQELLPDTIAHLIQVGRHHLESRP
ncbi:phosphotransferase family protein [Nocardioides humi]|uniref:Phosphotransferase family protein n=1 Tax=Nocardioides humi TaxID=449461 RepID=A0ABN2A6M2_9ACTN|nr:phosphotransferase family protein [Nocardioides humi]